VRAQVPEKGGPKLWAALMDELAQFTSARHWPVGNAQTLIPGISYSPYWSPDAWRASGFFLGDVFILVSST
jgi:hypothetical protein